MTPGELIRDRASARASASARSRCARARRQSAIARIESGDEEVTWGRLAGAMLTAMGEEPVLSIRPLAGRYDAAEHLLQIAPERRRLGSNSGLRFNGSRASSQTAGARARREMATG